MNASDLPIGVVHPYYPLGLEIAGYIKNEHGVLYLLGTFAAGCAVIFLLTGYIAKLRNPKLPTSEMLTVIWFVLCGCIHLFFEGYYSYNFRSMGSLQSVFGEMWKEYALSDSRYLTQHAFVLCMETITAVCWGPLSFVLAYLVTTGHPLRHPIQIIVSLGQLYGDVLYYATSYFDHMIYGTAYSRPEAYYYWGYYVGINFLWIAIPSMLIWQSVTAVARTTVAFGKFEERLQSARASTGNGQIAISKLEHEIKKTR